MLFRKKITPCCDYCVNAAKVNEEQVLCIKRGIMPVYGACRKFYYDPCKRIPPRAKAPDFSRYSEEDFKL